MNFKEKIKSGKFIITSEVGPPKGTDISELLEDADLLRDRVDAINVTDLQSSVMRLGSLVVSFFLKQRGHEPIFQLTCRDRNRLALQSDVLSAYALGIGNILALTGDHPFLGDHPQAKAVFDLDSISLIAMIRKLETGKDLADKALNSRPSFCVGAVVNPGAEPLELQLIKLEQKIKAGAEFIQTQAVYEVDKFARFMEQARSFNIPIFAGIVLLKSAGMARYMNKNVAGVFVPDNLIEEMEQTKDKATKSIEIAAQLIKELKPQCQGIHIMPIGWDKKVPLVLDTAGF